MKARRDGVCKICMGPIKQGDFLTPATLKGESGPQDQARSIWVHPECNPVTADADPIPVCKHWRRTGSCLIQSACLFRHPEELAKSAAAPDSEPLSRTWQSIAASSGSVHLHVKNLPLATSVAELTSLFSTFGSAPPSPTGRRSCLPCSRACAADVRRDHALPDAIAVASGSAAGAGGVGAAEQGPRVRLVRRQVLLPAGRPRSPLHATITARAWPHALIDGHRKRTFCASARSVAPTSRAPLCVLCTREFLCACGLAGRARLCASVRCVRCELAPRAQGAGQGAEAAIAGLNGRDALAAGAPLKATPRAPAASSTPPAPVPHSPRRP